ncbi:MAG: hypothetical protein ACI8TQ_000851 [Planctomycetota bacterium]|jgi:hypothetical protein
MGRGFLILTACASIAPLLLTEWIAVGGESTQSALFGLALCPWMILIGLPLGADSSKDQSAFTALAYALPILALAWKLDAGAMPATPADPAPWQGALAAFVCFGALGFAAYRAAGRSAWHGGLWLLLVLIAPALGWVITSFTDSEHAQSEGLSGDSLSDWSPLTLCLRLAAGEDRAISTLSIVCTGATLAVLIAAAEIDRRRS